MTLSSISVRTKPTKTSYYEGEMLDTSGLTLTAYYSNGSTKLVSSGFSCNPIGLAFAGTKTITVTYDGKTATFSVTVLPKTATLKIESALGGSLVGDGIGKNNSGQNVKWGMRINPDNFDVNNITSVKCSWTTSTICTNGKTDVGEAYYDHGWAAAKNGYTLWERVSTFDDNCILLMLPDNYAISGSQSITITGEKDGGTYTTTISFTLKYNGDYNTGIGWEISNISY